MYIVELIGEDTRSGAVGLIGLCEQSFTVLKKLADAGYVVNIAADWHPTGLPTPSDEERARFKEITERVCAS